MHAAEQDNRPTALVDPFRLTPPLPITPTRDHHGDTQAMQRSARPPNTVHDTVGKASRRAHEVIDTAEQRARDGLEASREKLKSANAAIEQMEAQAEVTLEDATATVTRYIQEKAPAVRRHRVRGWSVCLAADAARLSSTEAPTPMLLDAQLASVRIHVRSPAVPARSAGCLPGGACRRQRQRFFGNPVNLLLPLAVRRPGRCTHASCATRRTGWVDKPRRSTFGTSPAHGPESLDGHARVCGSRSCRPVRPPMPRHG